MATLLFLVVRLPQMSEGGKAWSDALRTAQSQVMAAFGMYAPPASPAEVESRQHQARQHQDQIVGRLKARPATAGELRWVYARSGAAGRRRPCPRP